MFARSVLSMQPREGMVEEVVSTFQRLGVPDRAMKQEGCLSVELQVPVEDDGPVIVTALWADRTKYDGWLNNPWRDESGEVLYALLTGPPTGVLYDVRVAAGDPVPAKGGQA
jgi:quinol monooxygenase YgiN